MKRCPTCQRTYNDDSLRYCLQDGAALLDASDADTRVVDPNATLTLPVEAISSGHDSPHTDILDQRTAPTAAIHAPATATTPQLHAATRSTQVAAPAAAPPATASSNRALTTGVIAIAVLLLALVGIGLALLLRGGVSGDNRNTATTDNARAGNSNAVEGQKNSNATSETNTNSVERPATPPKVTATASSTRSLYRGIDYQPANAVDRSLATAWVEGATGPGIGEWIRCDFDREVKLQRIIIAPGYFKSPQVWARNNRVASATLHFSDGSSREFRFPDRMEEQKLEMGAIKTAWVRVVINEVYFGADPDTAISQLAFEYEP